MSKPLCMMIHHTAVSVQKNSDQFKATNAYHQKKWNQKSSLGYFVGYHYEISALGKIKQARKDGEVSVACWQKKMNDGRCIHICLDGNFDTENPRPPQIYALRDLLRKLAKKYQISSDFIYFHRDFAKKSCPGKLMKTIFIKSLLEKG
jgi:N-acetyl-anhydromuramyl-L-alanine amidase AmpD